MLNHVGSKAKQKWFLNLNRFFKFHHCQSFHWTILAFLRRTLTKKISSVEAVNKNNKQGCLCSSNLNSSDCGIVPI
jgi:hypothetical protein